MKNLPISKIRSYILFVAFTLLIGGIGYRLGERRVTLDLGPANIPVIREQPPATLAVDFSLFWDVWTKLQRYYIDPVSLDTQKMVYGAISGMLSAIGDPYTSFFPPKENKEFKEDLGGAFEGIGAQLGLKDERIIVIAPLVGMPAASAGIQAGDYILEVDGVETVGWTVAQAVDAIRGPKGSSVTLTILHDGATEPVTVTVQRNTITVPSVVSWIKAVNEIDEIAGVEGMENIFNGQRIAYLQLSRFGDRTNSEWDKEVINIARGIAGNGIAGLVLDLRNNPGGYLDGSVYMASEFIEDGIVVSQVNSDGSKQDYQVNRKGKLLTIPLVILVNRGTASAAEILAGSLRDHDRATLIGEVTFGKGSVQTPFELSGGSGVHITTGKWLLPSGVSINNEGVKPDVEVDLAIGQSATADAQLAKAVEMLLQ